MKKIISSLLRHEYLIWILCAAAILRLPSLLEPYWYGDEGIYLTLGNAIRHGLTLYKDIHDNKPPGIYFMAALTGSVFWFRFFLLIWNSIAIVTFERLSHRLLDTQDRPGVTTIFGIEFPKIAYSTIATALFALLPFFAEGAIANGEIFMILPVIVGMLFLWQNMENGKWSLCKIVLSGLLFSLAFLIKVPSLFDAFAAGFFFCIVVPLSAYMHSRQEKISDFVIRYGKLALVFTLAFLIPIALSFAYYSAKGVGKQYVAAAFAQNIGYLSSWATGTHQASNVGSSGLKNRAIGFGIALVILTVLVKKNGKKTTLIAIWFAAALFGALLAERPYPHYLIQVIPPAALLLVFLVKLIKEKLESRDKNRGALILDSSFFPIQLVTFGIAIAIFVVSVGSIKFWYYPLFPYYQNYISFVTGAKSKEMYFAQFDRNLPAMYATAEYVASGTGTNDRVFVWGDYPMIYALSRRLPPGRYTSAYHIKDFNGFDETTAALEQTQPKYIVIDTNYGNPYPGLSAFLSGQYMHVTTSGPFTIYRRMAFIDP